MFSFALSIGSLSVGPRLQQRFLSLYSRPRNVRQHTRPRSLKTHFARVPLPHVHVALAEQKRQVNAAAQRAARTALHAAFSAWRVSAKPAPLTDGGTECAVADGSSEVAGTSSATAGTAPAAADAEPAGTVSADGIYRQRRAHIHTNPTFLLWDPNQCTWRHEGLSS